MSSESITQQMTRFYESLSRELKSGKINLPPFPEIAIRVRNVLEDPDSDIDSIVKILKLDPALSARVLQMANSANMSKGIDSPISDLKVAVSRVGLKVVRNAAMALAMQQIYQSSTTPASIKNFLDSLWLHSVDVAALSYVLAKNLSKLSPDEALLAGLLHDVGKLLILNRSEFYPDILADSRALEKIMNKWSPYLSGNVIKSWGLGKELSKVAKEHTILDRNPGPDTDLTDIVMLANLISQRNVINFNKPEDCIHTSALPRLKKTPDEFMNIVDEIYEEAKFLNRSLME